MIGAIILGIVAGFFGRLLMPGKDPMGFFATILLGLAGSVVGFLVFTELLGIGDNDVFDLGGLIGAIIGVMILLGVYRFVVRRGTTSRSGGTRPRDLSATPPDRSRRFDRKSTPARRRGASTAARPASPRPSPARG